MHKLRPYQRRAVKYLLAHKRGALFMEMRLGKTLCVLRALKACAPARARVLVVAPNAALGSWEQEAVSESLRFCYLTGTAQIRRRELEQGWTGGGLFLINKEGWRALPEIAGKAWDAVVLDESTFIKNPKAKVTRFFLQHFSAIPRKWILTGTPCPESEADYWCQLAFLHGHAFGFRSFWDFRARSMRPSYSGYGWVLKAGEADRMRRQVGRTCFVLRRKDVHLEKVRVKEQRVIEMPRKIRKAYAQMEEEFECKIDDVEASTMWSGAKFAHLRQLCGGVLNKQWVWDGKLDELLHLLQGELSGEKVVVWCCFNLEVHHLCEAIQKKGIRVAALTGADKPDARRAVFGAFQKSTGPRVLVLQQAIAQMGVDLSASDTAIYYSSPVGQMARRQTEDRIVSVAKDSPLLYIDLVVDDSVDEDVLELLEKKVKRGDLSLTRALQRAMKERKLWTK